MIPESEEGPVEIPIDGVLDLHTFRPSDVGDLVPEYVAACHAKGLRQIRIIHGKGTGQMQKTVHVLLSRDPHVKSFALDHPQYGGWGATIAHLNATPAQDRESFLKKEP